MGYENSLIYIIIILFLLLLYVFISSKRKIGLLEKHLYDRSAHEMFLDILPFPVLYEKKYEKTVFTNKAFDMQFGINKKTAIETLYNQHFNPLKKMDLSFDNDVIKKVLIYSSSIMDTNKNITAVIRSVIDINDLQTRILDLLSSKHRYNLAVDQALFGVWDWDIEKDRLYVSDQWKKIMGYEEKEHPKDLNSWLNLVVPKDMAKMNASIKQHLSGLSEIFVEDHEVKLAMGKRWVQVRGKATFDHNHEAVRFSGLIFDVTEDKKIEKEKNTSRRLFATFMENLPAMAFIKDSKNRYIYLNSFYQNYIGFKEWKNRTPFDIFDEKTAQHIVNNDKKALYEGKKKHEEVIPNAEGIPKYFRSYKFPIEADGHEKFICGLGIDSTKEKLYLDEINLYSKIFDNTTEIIIMTDKDFNIISVNRAFETNTGYTKKDALGKNPKFLIPMEENDRFYENIDDALRSGIFSGEVTIATKDKKIIPEIVNINCIRDEHKKIVNYFAIFQNIAKQKQIERKFKQMAQYDTLTKLPNRFLFKFRLLGALERVHQLNIKIALIFVDLDDFKKVNDTLGHDAGDIVLVQTARKLSQSIRENDTVARLGGDEFVVILEDIQDIAGLRKICEKIMKNLNEPFELQESIYRIRASLGVSISPDQATDYHELLKYSDKAMYKAKNQGKNKIVIYNLD